MVHYIRINLRSSTEDALYINVSNISDQKLTSTLPLGLDYFWQPIFTFFSLINSILKYSRPDSIER